MLTMYQNIFDELRAKGIFHFASYVSASQYSMAYDLVRKYGKEGLAALDWGTGSGHFSYFLLSQGFTVTAFTIERECYLSESLQNSYKEKYRPLVDQHPKRSLPFDDESFDLVVSIGVLEHVRDTNNTEIDSLSEIRRVLKPDGIFICYHFPNKYSWIEALTKHLSSKYNHNFKYSRNDIVAMTATCKLQLLEYKRYGIMPRNSFRFVPNNKLLTQLFNVADSTLSTLLNIFCQNQYFVAQKQTE
jgi:ubiquinone/menaquinone biosynthesis C-methylase UbiE